MATTREEDMTYCTLGHFEINMPLLYIEGARAFTRPQHGIIRTSNDDISFCQTWDEVVPVRWTGLLAPSPAQLRSSHMFAPWSPDLFCRVG